MLCAPALPHDIQLCTYAAVTKTVVCTLTAHLGLQQALKAVELGAFGLCAQAAAS